MKRIQFEPLIIQEIEEEKFHVSMHSQNYYELIHIAFGSGIHVVNSNTIAYKAGDVFLVSPDDVHYFEIIDKTRFTFVLFTEDYFLHSKMFMPDHFLNWSPTDLMRNKYLKEAAVQFSEASRQIFQYTLQQISTYYLDQDLIRTGWVYLQLMSLFSLVKMTIGRDDKNQWVESGQKNELILYIQQYIYQPQKLKRNVIADYFNISDAYFSTFFKRIFGISYQDFINQYRLKLIEKRLQNKLLNLKMIAEELGFVDESHLSHFFKKMKGISPQKFRD